jgi:glycosyltransferase involved in cell wall biosynthesis
VVHFNSPHIWNPILLLLLRCARIPTVQTLHDLDPHSGTGYGRLLYAWNNLVVRLATHILVHGQVYRTRLIQQGVPPERITCIPLLHLFLSYDNMQRLQLRENTSMTSDQADAQSDLPFALFFARIEAYKGVDILIEAVRQIEAMAHQASSPASELPPLRVVIAGEGNLPQSTAERLPGNVEIRNRLIKDDEATVLFRNCSVVVLPYIDATQSALIASAYFFGKPVIVTQTGALPEYVINGETGWVIEPRNPQALADCLLTAFSDPARLVRMGEAGRAWYWAQRRIEYSALLTMYRQAATGSNS